MHSPTIKRSIVLTCAFVALLVWLFRSHVGHVVPNLSTTAAFESAVPPPASPSPPAKTSHPSPALPPLEISDLARDLNSHATDIRADLNTLGVVIDTFRSNARANPTGTNAEITAILTGKNAFRLALIPPAHTAINARGELCDRWGRPFFFHQVSGTHMEIRSAGPDRKMWTTDDTLFVP